MTRKFMTTVALGSLFAGGIAVSHLALAQDGGPGPGSHRGMHGGGMMMMADANKDGTITRAELTAGVEARFARLDINKDGKLDQQDRALMHQQRLDARFTQLDTDKNGQISKAEFAAGHQGRFDRHDRGGKAGGRHHGFGPGMMPGDPDGANRDGPVTREQFLARPLAMFNKADANKDGKVTAEELKAARQAMRDGWKDRKAPSAAE